MTSNILFSNLLRRGRTVGTRLLILFLSCASFLFSSCTTEEGVIVGALAGAAIGGVVGHSHENAYRRGHRSSNHYYSSGYRYAPRYSSYRSRGYYADPYCY